MEQIINKNWEYILYKTEEEYFLSVVCGSSAIFERIIRLHPEERKKYLESGQKYIDEFARKISYSPDSFSDRNLHWFDKHIVIQSLNITLNAADQPPSRCKIEKTSQTNEYLYDLLFNISEEIVTELEKTASQTTRPTNYFDIEIITSEKTARGTLPIGTKSKTTLDYFANAMEKKLKSSEQTALLR